MKDPRFFHQETGRGTKYNNNNYLCSFPYPDVKIMCKKCSQIRSVPCKYLRGYERMQQ